MRKKNSAFAPPEPRRRWPTRALGCNLAARATGGLRQVYAEVAQAQYEAARAMWDDGGDVAADGTRIYRGAKAYKQYTATAESYDRQVNSGAGPARGVPQRRRAGRDAAGSGG